MGISYWLQLRVEATFFLRDYFSQENIFFTFTRRENESLFDDIAGAGVLHCASVLIQLVAILSFLQQTFDGNQTSPFHQRRITIQFVSKEIESKGEFCVVSGLWRTLLKRGRMLRNLAQVRICHRLPHFGGLQDQGMHGALIENGIEWDNTSTQHRYNMYRINF